MQGHSRGLGWLPQGQRGWRLGGDREGVTLRPGPVRGPSATTPTLSGPHLPDGAMSGPPPLYQGSSVLDKDLGELQIGVSSQLRATKPV